jgi:hypothetical protein
MIVDQAATELGKGIAWTNREGGALGLSHVYSPT